MTRRIPRSEGVFLVLVFQIILLTSSYFIYYGIDNLNFSRELTEEEKEIEQLECLEKYAKGKTNVEDSALIFFYCGEYYSKTGKGKKEAMCILEKAKDSKNRFTLVQGIALCQKKFNPIKE